MANQVKQIANIQDTFLNGSKSVGTSAVQVIVTSRPTSSGVLLKAGSGNSGKVYVGSNSDITIDSSPTTDGFELGAGEAILIEVDNVNKVYAIASALAQKLYWISL